MMNGFGNNRGINIEAVIATKYHLMDTIQRNISIDLNQMATYQPTNRIWAMENVSET